MQPANVSSCRLNPSDVPGDVLGTTRRISCKVIVSKLHMLYAVLTELSQINDSATHHEMAYYLKGIDYMVIKGQLALFSF